MEFLKNILESFLERLKTSWAEQQESPWFIALKERFEELPPLSQKLVMWTGFLFVATLILYWPATTMMDASEMADRFEEKRYALKDLLHITRDVAAAPTVLTPGPPSSLKAIFDQKIAAASVKPEQVKSSGEIPTSDIMGAEQRGYFYQIHKLTIKQAVSLAFELEHADFSLKLSGFELIAQNTDPHFYDVNYKIVNFAPKTAQSLLPGGGLLDAVKSKLPPPPPSIPKGQAPSIPSNRGEEI